MRMFVFFCCVSFVLLGSCGSDGGQLTNDSGTTPVDTSDTSGSDDSGPGTETSVAGECAGMPNLTGAAFVATKLVATKPTKEVNPIWAQEIADSSLNLVFYIEEHNAETGMLTIKVTSASADMVETDEKKMVPVSYVFAKEPTVFQTKLSDCSFTIDGIELDIQTTNVSKPFHIFGLKGSGTLAPTGKSITDVSLKGGIREDMTFDLCLKTPMGFVSFHWFMNLAGICPEWDSDNDEIIDSYFFEGHLAAKATDIYVPDKIVMIEPPDGKCDTHDDKCVAN